MAELSIPKDDKGFDITFAITDADNNAFDVSGYVITRKIWPQGNTSSTIVTGTCSIHNVEASGSVKYTVQASDFTTARNYVGELELTRSGIIESTKKFSVSVTESA